MVDQKPAEKRKGKERRKTDGCYDGVERRKTVVDRRCGLDRRRGPGKRRSEDRKQAEEGQMNDEQFDFIMAIDEYKRQNQRPFPTWTEVLEIIKALGYRKVAEPEPLDEAQKSKDKAKVGCG